MGYYSTSGDVQCQSIPCYIDSFTVTVTDEGSNVYRLTLTDSCDVVTNLKLLSGILRKAFDAVVAADSLTAEDCGCCRDGAELSFNLAGKYAEFTTTATVTEDDYTVTKPFKSGS